MSQLQEYLSRFKTEVIYLWNDDAECYVKSDPVNGYFAKYPGKKEYKIAADTDTVTLAISGKHEVSESEYLKA